MRRRVGGRPARFGRDALACWRRSRSRCQRRTVSGETIKCSCRSRARGSRWSRAARYARSGEVRRGLSVWRCRTASWWRSVRISMSLSVSLMGSSRMKANTLVSARSGTSLPGGCGTPPPLPGRTCCGEPRPACCYPASAPSPTGPGWRYFPSRGTGRRRGTWVRVIEYTVTVTTTDPTTGTATTRTELFRLLTTITDPQVASAVELAGCYCERWESETGYKALKTHQRGPRTVLRSTDPDGVRQEVYAYLITYQAIRHLMVQAATAEGIDPDRLSFTTALPARRTEQLSHPRRQELTVGAPPQPTPTLPTLLLRRVELEGWEADKVPVGQRKDIFQQHIRQTVEVIDGNIESEAAF
jgi:hypothetical protein